MLRAFSEKYCREIPDECIDMCAGISGGFGVNSVCAAVAAAIMILGISCPEEEVPHLRIEIIDKVYDEYKSINCAHLKFKEDDCSVIISRIAKIVDEILERELSKAEIL